MSRGEPTHYEIQRSVESLRLHIDERMDNTDKRLSQLERRQDDIRDTLAQWSGGRKVVVWVLSFFAAAGTAVAAIFSAR